MGKFIAAIAGLLLTTVAARAAEWHSYSNARFGYRIEIPPSFSKVAEAENGDAGFSRTADYRSELRVWGGHITEADFKSEIKWRIDQDLKDGWQVSYRKENPAWASWSGTKGVQIFYERAILACDGAAAYFRLE